MTSPVHRLVVCPDWSAVCGAAAERFVALAHERAARAGRFTVCLSGGATPRPLYAMLAGPGFADAIPWTAVHVFWGDERCLPPEHGDNHFRLATDLMLSKVPIPAVNIHRIRGESPEPAAAAAEYEREIVNFFRLPPRITPRFDLMLLGMGADGHVASLFPGTPGLQEERRLVTAHFVPRLGAHRLTLTLPVLLRAREVMVLVAGEQKAEVLKAVFEGSDEPGLPARRLAAADGDVLWVVDEAAASRLPAGRQVPGTQEVPAR